jgi:hypothetical protein
MIQTTGLKTTYQNMVDTVLAVMLEAIVVEEAAGNVTFPLVFDEMLLTISRVGLNYF